MPYVFFTVICLIWGASFILMKKALYAFGPISVGGWRVLGGAAALLVLWQWQALRSLALQSRVSASRTQQLPGSGEPGYREPGHASPARRWSLTAWDLPHMAGIVLVGYAWPYAIQPHLVGRHGSAFIGMTVSLVPLLTLIVSAPMLGVYPSRRQLLGVLGGLACLTLLMGDGLARSIPLFDLALAVSVPLCYAVTNTYIRRRLAGVSALALSLTGLLMTSAILLPLGIATEPVVHDEHFSLAVWSVAILGVLGTGVGTYLFNRLIQEQGPLFAGMTTYLVPVGAVIWGWADHESVTALQLAALAGIFAMVALVQFGAALDTKPRAS